MYLFRFLNMPLGGGGGGNTDVCPGRQIPSRRHCDGGESTTTPLVVRQLTVYEHFGLIGQYARYKHWRRSLLDGRAAAARPHFAPRGRPYLRPAHFGAKSGTFYQSRT